MAAVIAWLSAHSAVLAGAVVAVLDLVFALSPSLAANGILHWIYLQLQALLGNGKAS